MHSSSAAWRHAVDLVDQQQVGEYGAGVEGEVLGTGAQNRGAQNVGGHQVGRGLHALESEAEQPSQSFHDERFGDARHAFEEHVALAEDGDQDLFNGVVLAGDNPAQLGAGVGDELASGLKCLRVRRLLIFLAHEAPSFDVG